MFDIYRLFYEIVLFKKGPQDVPFSPFLTRITLIIYVLVSFVMSFMNSHWSVALLQTAIDIALLMFFTRLSLAWVNKSERYQQTFCALLGTDTILTLAAIPVTAVMLIPSGDMAVLAFFIFIAVILWHWTVIGHILHHALEQPLGFSLGLALLYMMSVYAIIGLLFSR